MNCRICASPDVRKYFEVRNSPRLQNVLYSSADAARTADVVDAGFWVCDHCLFLFNPRFENQRYDAQYNNDQSFSASYRAHLAQIAALLGKYLSPGVRIVEIGCGNGMLLGMLSQAGYQFLEGYDPAHSNDLPFVRKEYWRPAGKPCGALILRHTLEALVDFREVLSAAALELDPDGILYLELTNARFIVEHASTVTLYPEYPQYFSEIAITILLSGLGLYVHELQHFLGGEILGVIARRKRLRTPRAARLEKLAQFANIYIWGISGRTVHFLTHYGIDTRTISQGVDIDPKKQGKYIPRTGQKIVSPEECIARRPDAIVVLNRRYVAEVARLFSYPVVILTDGDFYDE